MRHLIKYENYQNINSSLIIVDVQKDFREYFTEMYLHELKKYCENFSKVYQIWDNHEEDINTDYLYKDNPKVPINNNLYNFPNQVDIIEKRYNYNITIDFYKKILDNNTYKGIKKDEESGNIKIGSTYETKKNTILVYIGNKHRWFHVGKKLINLFKKYKGQTIYLVGGGKNECLQDIYISAKSFGVNIIKDDKYIYSAKHCPIR